MCETCTYWPTAHSSMSKNDKKKKGQKYTPSCSTKRLPVLEGRNQPALKIDLRRERSCAAAEGEHAGRGGGWQLVAWIIASQTGPMAILHTLCPGPLACPAQQWAIKAMQKGHPYQQWAIPDAPPWGKNSPGGRCPNNTLLEVNLDTAWAGLTVQGKINEGTREKETDSYNGESNRESYCTNKGGGGRCSDVMAWLASPLGHSWKWSVRWVMSV